MTKTNKQSWRVYMIRCKNGSVYTGITNDLARRFAEHQGQGDKCAKYLKGKGPLALVYSENVEDKQSALKKEAYIKRQSKADKEKMIKRNS
jgi:putative endonuclease